MGFVREVAFDAVECYLIKTILARNALYNLAKASL